MTTYRKMTPLKEGDVETRVVCYVTLVILKSYMEFFFIINDTLYGHLTDGADIKTNRLEDAIVLGYTRIQVD